MAATLWLYVVSEGLSKASIEAPVVFKNLPADLTIVECTEHITISMEGPEVLLKNIHEENIKVTVDLSNAKPGSATVNISEKNVKLPGLFRIQSIQPQYFRVKLDRKLKKTVSIKAVLKGQPAKGFYVDNVVLVPDKIQLEGPFDILKGVDIIKTVPVDIDGIREREEYVVALDVRNSLIVPSSKRITLSIEIGRKEE
ncbi:MAG TPA: CdaR family protein [Thermodesulfovibrionia bacterium]|nr:CdaR family protein [Thermodesulfovibrionia bacterium]